MWKGIAVFAVCCASLAGCEDRVAIDQVGYFKSGANDRVYTFTYDPATVSPEALRAHGDGLMYSARKMTAAYYYPVGSSVPKAELTMARGLGAANDVLYEDGRFSRWTHAYMKYMDGSTSFSDCQETPHDDLCLREQQ
jgi:hypothetical protein